ncbi:AraC family transcriptional regulator [uncultured Phocaeicola sp.]|uniref:helix-turn-helix domain-containing protein n=1 Tax=uncultured Phocaeicola sp. TaxID=990718 RepID=UPI0025FC72AC|nr:helix-turn-helix domain-containing protein [uncultured Phocaeicola sp.]
MDTNEKELPKIDLPEDWVIGTGINKDLLALYTHYPVRLKCEMFVLCLSGEVNALVNLNEIQVHPNDVITLMPGSIFQINEIQGDLKIYFLGFSSEFIERSRHSHSLLDAIFLTLGRPAIPLKPQGAVIMEKYLQMLIAMYEGFNEKIRHEIAPNLYADIHTGISILYQTRQYDKITLSKSEQLCRSFMQLVTQHYNQTRNVNWYAQQLNITHAHLCSVVKQITGKTCADVIASMVIMDAKSQLKSTKLTIQAIADSLNFANISFFGKYFKRHVGISPMEYRKL